MPWLRMVPKDHLGFPRILATLSQEGFYDLIERSSQLLAERADVIHCYGLGLPVLKYVINVKDSQNTSSVCGAFRSPIMTRGAREG